MAERRHPAILEAMISDLRAKGISLDDHETIFNLLTASFVQCNSEMTTENVISKFAVFMYYYY